MFVEVALPVNIRQTFTYSVPPELNAQAKVGCRALVPFGTRVLTGIIVATQEQISDSTDESSIKDLRQILDDEPAIDSEILELTRWIAGYYFAPWGECLRAALPAGATSSSSRTVALTEEGHEALLDSADLLTPVQAEVLRRLAEREKISVRFLERESGRPLGPILKELEHEGLVKISRRMEAPGLQAKTERVVRLVRDSDSEKTKIDPQQNQPGTRVTAQQRAVLDLLATSDEVIAVSDLLDQAGTGPGVIRTLEKRGLVEVFERQVRRDPLSNVRPTPVEVVKLNDEQQHALDRIIEALNGRTYSGLLLHGVTGSGKTEVYIRAMLETLSRGQSTLMLVPEIGLTPVLARRLRSHFGDSIAILHSALSEGERTDEWRRIRRGEARVAIGTRSAIFAPLKDLGLIIVDEEHEASYKQEETPRYNGRDTAIMRASRAGAVVVLGSATPSIESFQNANSGKYNYVRLEKRYLGRDLAEVEIVDMREVFKRHGKAQIFSDELVAAIEATHARGEQTIILLNRRGFSVFALCRSCGQAIKCPNCDVTLTYHRYNQSLLCHYCGYIRPAPKLCPSCDGSYMHYVGEGTEKLEDLITELFPDLRVARVDRDTMRKRGSFEYLAMEFEAGTIDLLVGTQILAKGHDFPNVTLVGVISVDVALSLPDFRAAERTFQLLTQVAGRAGRGSRKGRVLIQTYHPTHYSLLYAKDQDYESFYNREIGFRKSMHYPPFAGLINVLVRDKEIEKASGAAADLAREVREIARSSKLSLTVLGPAPAPLARLKGEYRFQVLLKTGNRKQAREALQIALDRLTTVEKGSGKRRHNPRLFTVDVDPMNLM